MAQDAKQELVDYLEEHAFEPILRADPEDYSEDDRRKLEDVQRATRSEVERFRGYDSARDVVDNFEDDLSSDEAEEVNRKLRALKLPTLHDVREGFEKLAQKHHIDA